MRSRTAGPDATSPPLPLLSSLLRELLPQVDGLVDQREDVRVFPDRVVVPRLKPPVPSTLPDWALSGRARGTAADARVCATHRPARRPSSPPRNRVPP